MLENTLITTPIARNSVTILEMSFDPLAFESWVQIVALLILTAGGVTWKWLSNMKDKQDDTVNIVEEIRKTLTTNNGGTHIKDQLDRIEAVQAQQAALLAADSQKLTDHLAWTDGYVRDTTRRLDSLICQRRATFIHDAGLSPDEHEDPPRIG